MENGRMRAGWSLELSTGRNTCEQRDGNNGAAEGFS